MKPRDHVYRALVLTKRKSGKHGSWKKNKADRSAAKAQIERELRE